MRRSLLLLVAAIGLAAPLGAQLRNPTRRPPLAEGADTNDAQQYYNFGVARLDRDPQAAADAFYWASRINPGWADALYARRIALLVSDPRRLQRYMRGDRGVRRSKDIRQIDSLYLRALMQNPFLSQRLDRVVLDAWIRALANEYTRGDRMSAAEVEQELQVEIRRNASLGMRAWLSYGSGNFPRALDDYAEAIKHAKRKASLRIDRGRLLFQLGQVDSALVELSLALEEMRRSDEKDIVVVYESKAFLEHGIAMIHERRNEIDQAKEAYGRALTEDLSYYPAHLRLGFVALETKDTATALNEFALAVQIRGDEPMLRYLHAHVLSVANRLDEAEAELKKAVELEPLFAMPHFLLGQIYDQQMKPEQALASYRSFLSLSARVDGRRVDAQRSVEQLQATAQAGSVKP